MSNSLKDRNIKHIFFDLDHTLWDFDRNSSLTFELLFERRKIQVPLGEFLEVYVPNNVKFWKMFREGKISKKELRYIRLRTTFDTLDYSINDREIKDLANDYLSVLPSFNHLFEGAELILSYLNLSYKLHIITNGFAEVQTGKLRNSGILHYFDEIVNSEMAGVKKPNPYIFKLAMKRAGAVPSNSLMIGDNLEADIIGAHNVGMYTLFFNVNGDVGGDDMLQVNRLLDIKNLL